MANSRSGDSPPVDRSGGDYDETPSFYNSDETFEKYLGQTSYYLALQKSLLEVVSYIEPDQITEFGSGTGQTTLRLAEEFERTTVLGIDNRENVVEVSEENTEKAGVSNAVFGAADMTEYVVDADDLAEFVVMLYSFHHIPDPLGEKVEFLSECHTALDDGAYLCIGETFLENGALDGDGTQGVEQRWEQRGLEGYASTFWSALDGLDDEDIDHAQDAGDYSQRHEVEAGENVHDRDNEYLISMDWLEATAEDVGFEVVLAEPVNALGDGIVLLQK